MFVLCSILFFCIFFFACSSLHPCFFFFQAEDGIRDLVRSRGLGDVYKRQLVINSFICEWLFEAGSAVAAASALLGAVVLGFPTVSYTHLTLPTSDLV